MDDQFAKPQSNGAALLKGQTLPWNTVPMYMALFRGNIVKQKKLEKQNVEKRMTNVQMFRAVGDTRNFPGCNQMTFLATRSGA